MVDPETQIGILQDQITELNMKVNRFGFELEGGLRQISQMVHDQKASSENVIRLDEAVKGLREQGKEHNTKQLELMATAGQNISALLSAMGIDPTKPETVEAVRKDFIEMRNRRVKREGAWDWFTKSLIGGLVAAGLFALWEGIKSQLGGAHVGQ